MDMLKTTFEKILKLYGHDVFLQRRLDLQEGTYSDVLERFTVRHQHKMRLPLVADEMGEGIVHDANVVYYFTAEAKPREGDRIYDPDDRYPGGYGVWLLDYAQPMRGLGGIVVYWEAGVTRKNPN